MSKYKTLIFDLDDTLIDNKASVDYAFEQILHILHITPTEDLLNKWLAFERDYWLAYESNQLKLPTDFSKYGDKISYLRAKRFMIFFHRLNLSYEQALRINTLYCDMLGVNIISIDKAIETLSELYSEFELCVATNGPKEAANNKLSKANLMKYIKTVVSSEEANHSKPNKEFFDYLFSKMSYKNKDGMLMIGDSLSTDVLGGMNNGLDTCWYNPRHRELPEKYKPTMTITKLDQLKKLL